MVVTTLGKDEAIDSVVVENRVLVFLLYTSFEHAFYVYLLVKLLKDMVGLEYQLVFVVVAKEGGFAFHELLERLHAFKFDATTVLCEVNLDRAKIGR